MRGGGEGHLTSPTLTRPTRTVALSIVVALLAAMLAMVSAPQAAKAAGNQVGVGGRGDNVIYAYVQAGESLTASGDAGRIGVVTEPDGTTHSGPATYGPATDDGVWTVELVTAGPNTGYNWSVDVVSAAGTVIPGRAWSSSDIIVQTAALPFADLDYWVVNNAGYVYSVELDGYNGINSVIGANSVGWADDECVPTYASYEYDPTDVGSNAPPVPDCGEDFRIFYEEPAADLPATAPSAQGEVTILPALLGTGDLEVDDLVFAPTSTGAAAGTFAYSIDPRFIGGYLLQVDVDGNGSYADDVDRAIRRGADGSGSYVSEFDGIDANGDAIQDCTAMNARIYFDKLGETHIIQTDVEAREGGISITRLNGAGAPDSRIHWNDEGMIGTRATTTDPLVGAGVDSSAGVHDWTFDTNGWGNGRYIDDWAYLPADFGTGELAIGGRCLSVEKSSDAVDGVDVGDVVTYTVTVTNNGTSDYTVATPASITDDLSGVLDDADYNGDVRVEFSGDSSSGAPAVADDSLVWTGPLQVGEVATITYSVTLTSGGDQDLVNVVCETSTDNCDSVGLPLPHVLFAKSSDPESGAAVEAGQVVTYTLTFGNDGEASGVVDSVDDLTEIVDDADITGAPVSSDPAVTATLRGDSIRIVGEIDVGQTITVTYQATVKPDGERGDNRLENVLVPDIPVPQVPPVVHPIGELDDWKTVDPASGSTVQPGRVMTYTLHFENIGKAPVAVDREDLLTQVLDDATVTSVPVSSDAALTVTAVRDERFGISGSLEPGQLVTVTYQVTVNADGDRGDDRLGNFLVDPGDVETECVPADDERPDCTVDHVSNVVVTKSADPASGTKVEHGERVTYTLTFRNVSTNPAAADAAIDYTDHMADVLDDATPTGAPAASDAALTATAAGDTIRVEGVVASGETVTVTYAVTVKPYTDQGDHHLGNVVAVTGGEPVCAPGSSLCTSHEVEEPEPLAVTGGEIAWGVAAGGVLLLLIGGGTVLLARSRREDAETRLS